MIVEHLLAIHERGNRSNPDNRYFILALTHHPQRFVQCIFHDIDTTLLCEASSGRYGPAPGQPHTLQLSAESAVVLTRLGFTEPHGIANYSQEIALGDPPDFEGTAELLLETMYEVYGARIGASMGLTAPLLGPGVTKVDRCKPLS